MWGLPEYLLRKREKVNAFRERLSDPAAEPTPLRAVVRVAAGSGVRPAQVRSFTIITDAGPALGGFELGPTAPELLLSALGSCLAHSWAVVAADHGVAFETLEVEVTGKIDYRGTLAVSEQAPVAPYDLAYHVSFASPADNAAIARIQADVERLCPVLQALKQPVAIQGSVARKPIS
jgi:uncharacterized OsmC-like protein